MHNKIFHWVLDCWNTHIWGMITTNQKEFNKFIPSYNEIPWYKQSMIMLGVIDIKCEVKNKILTYRCTRKLQNISCKMKREVLNRFTKFYTSWNETNNVPQHFTEMYLEKYISFTNGICANI
jgi:hypothetical protein